MLLLGSWTMVGDVRTFLLVTLMWFSHCFVGFEYLHPDLRENYVGDLSISSKFMVDEYEDYVIGAEL